MAMALLFLAIFGSILGLTILFPILGPLGRSLGLSETEIGSISTGYALAQFLTAPFWGKQSEKWGRKKVILVGLFGFCFGFAAFGWIAMLGLQGSVNHKALIAGLIASLFLGGALCAATLPTAQAYAADFSETSDRTRAMAAVGAAFGLAIVVGPGIGALAARIGGLLAPIWLSVILSLVNALLVTLFLPEPKRRHQSTNSPGLLNVAQKVPHLLIAGFATTMASVAMEQTIAFVFEDRLKLRHDEAPGWIGIGLVAYGISAVFAQGILVRSFSLSPRALLLSGLPLAAISMALLAIANSFTLLLICLACQGLGQGMIGPGITAALSLGVDQNEQGTIAGIHSSSQALGRLAGPLVGGGLYEWSEKYPYIFGAGLFFLLLILLSNSKELKSPKSIPIT
ncbi:MAG: MFS transporter [Sandaracinaceae bacterium]|nr:MFS transporter [Sandaracinaceae bacterium]